MADDTGGEKGLNDRCAVADSATATRGRHPHQREI